MVWDSDFSMFTGDVLHQVYVDRWRGVQHEQGAIRNPLEELLMVAGRRQRQLLSLFSPSTLRVI